MDDKIETLLRNHFAQESSCAPSADGLLSTIQDSGYGPGAKVTRFSGRHILLALGGGLAAASVLAVVLIATSDGGKPGGDTPPPISADCLEAYSPSGVAQREFALAGTVTSITESAIQLKGPSSTPYTEVEFDVDTWYIGTGGSTATVLMLSPNTGIEDAPFPFKVGDRLLSSGDIVNFGAGDPWLQAWGCGYTRPFTSGEATLWSQATGGSN